MVKKSGDKMLNPTKYIFGFTAASLRLGDFVQVAQYKREEKAIDHVTMLGAGKSATGNRMINEYNKRLITLTKDQTDILIDSGLSSQKHIAFLAICKTYAFIRDFTVEVVREKLLLFDYELTEGEFITFLRRKAETHPELEIITEKTTAKMKQVTFKILEQAGIIDNVKSKVIQPQLIEKDVVVAIANENKEWLKVLLLSDIDINNA